MSILDEIRACADGIQVRRMLEARRNELIIEARRQGVSWKEIQSATGLTRQAAMNAAQKAKRLASGD